MGLSMLKMNNMQLAEAFTGLSTDGIAKLRERGSGMCVADCTLSGMCVYRLEFHMEESMQMSPRIGPIALPINMGSMMVFFWLSASFRSRSLEKEKR